MKAKETFDRLLREPPSGSVETLAVILGDQLDADAALLRRLRPQRDAVLMAEVREESEHTPSHVQRTTLFLAAMRHFAVHLAEKGFRVRYVTLDAPENSQSLGGELARAIRDLSPERVAVTQPGEHRVAAQLEKACRKESRPLDTVPDESFTCSREEFDEWAQGRRQLVMEYFYRDRRRALDLLMEGGKPAGGKWNYDEDNRKAFRETPRVRVPYRPREDALTAEVRERVREWFPDLPGGDASFGWCVTRAQALRALADFVEHRLPEFGAYEDAMWSGETVLYHSTLSPYLNLKLLRPRECVDAAVAAYERGDAPLNSVEGFVRQIIGWREFIRGVYYREGAAYVERNALEQTGRLPEFFWSGETEMNCLRDCLGGVIEGAYGHHIPRLMVIGNFTLMAGVAPRAVEDWFLGMYVDAVEWVTAPNVVGMSQHADGGVVGTKPYVSTGKYIDRMSNYCGSCAYNPARRTGDNACPFTVMYWDFLMRHRERFRGNPRMGIPLKNVERIRPEEQEQIRERAAELRREWGVD